MKSGLLNVHDDTRGHVTPVEKIAFVMAFGGMSRKRQIDGRFCICSGCIVTRFSVHHHYLQFSQTPIPPSRLPACALWSFLHRD